MLLHTYKNNKFFEPFKFHRYVNAKVFLLQYSLNDKLVSQLTSAMVMTKERNILYACTTKDNFQVTKFKMDENSSQWEENFDLPRAENDDVEYILQLKLNKEEDILLATTGNGFVVWFLENNKDAIILVLPNGVRNISTRMMCSNSIMISGTKNYAVAGVR